MQAKFFPTVRAVVKESAKMTGVVTASTVIGIGIHDGTVATAKYVAEKINRMEATDPSLYNNSI